MFVFRVKLAILRWWNGSRSIRNSAMVGLSSPYPLHTVSSGYLRFSRSPWSTAQRWKRLSQSCCSLRWGSVAWFHCLQSIPFWRFRAVIFHCLFLSTNFGSEDRWIPLETQSLFVTSDHRPVSSTGSGSRSIEVGGCKWDWRPLLPLMQASTIGMVETFLLNLALTMCNFCYRLRKKYWRCA